MQPQVLPLPIYLWCRLLRFSMRSLGYTHRPLRPSGKQGVGNRGIICPARVVIEMPVLLIHHDPDIWGVDMHEFRPERFTEEISKASNIRSTSLPFGWGPRTCNGQNLALLDAMMAVCMILQHFEFHLAPWYTHVPHNGKMLRPMYGAQIKLRAIV
jgi:cytochrome P450